MRWRKITSDKYVSDDGRNYGIITSMKTNDDGYHLWGTSFIQDLVCRFFNQREWERSMVTEEVKPQATVHIGLKDPQGGLELCEQIIWYFTDRNKYLGSDRRFETRSMKNRVTSSQIHYRRRMFSRRLYLYITQDFSLRYDTISIIRNGIRIGAVDYLAKNKAIRFTGLIFEAMKDELQDIFQELKCNVLFNTEKQV